MAQLHGMQPEAVPGRADAIRKATNTAGAAISLALMVGIGIWGYRILVRDVSGVPVVRAVEGPVRVLPDDPGGQEALHQGLAVNGVAAEGAAARPADRLVLAPEPLELSLDDVPATTDAGTAPAATGSDAEAGEKVMATGAARVQLAALDGPAPAIVDAAAPDARQPDGADETAAATAGTEPAEAPAEDDAAAESADAVEPVAGGLGRSLRPRPRPAEISSIEEAVAASVAAGASVQAAVNPDTIPAGTRMAQLGAFESAEVAETEWNRLAGRFGEYLEDKQRVIQRAQSGGRTFYRLRAMGFADLNDARRFCSALLSEKTECIPVVTR